MKEENRIPMLMNIMSDHIKDITANLDFGPIKNLIDEIMNSNRIFLIGTEMSGITVKAFAMRLMHVGFNIYIIGEVVTPPIKPDDLAISISYSGNTQKMVNIATMVKKIGPKLATITSNKDSALGKISDIVMVHDADTDTIFELTTLVLLDSIISELMIRRGVNEEYMLERHMFSNYACMLNG